MGHGRFLAFYLRCGAAAAIVHAVAFPYSQTPLIGASGAVAGIMAAYLILHPRVKLWVLVLARIPLRISAMWAIGAWIVFQLVSVLLATDSATAWWAHIGGLVAGAVLIPFFRRPGVPLLDRGLPT
jgi:membrane associated rhomboid family serine protease